MVAQKIGNFFDFRVKMLREGFDIFLRCAKDTLLSIFLISRIYAT